MITIHPIPAFNDNYIWAIMHGDHAVIVDPGDAAPVLAWLTEEQKHLAAILITHKHADHIGGVETLINQFPVPVYGPEVITCITKPVTEGNLVNLFDSALKLEVMAVPGHTLEHIAYYGNGLLLCGDTLFSGGCGRVFEGTMEQMHESLQKFAALPDDTQVLCAHEYTLGNLRFGLSAEPNNVDIANYIEAVEALRADGKPSLPSTLGREKAINVFLRAHNAAAFAKLRQWKNNV